MSRNSKNASRIKAAREGKGKTGPAKTTPVHGKAFANRSKYNRKDRGGVEANKRQRSKQSDSAAAE